MVVSTIGVGGSIGIAVGSKATVVVPGVCLRVCLWLSLCLPFLPAIVAIVVGVGVGVVASIVTRVCQGGIGVAITVGVAIATVVKPGVSLRISFSCGLRTCLSLGDLNSAFLRSSLSSYRSQSHRGSIEVAGYSRALGILTSSRKYVGGRGGVG